MTARHDDASPDTALPSIRPLTGMIEYQSFLARLYTDDAFRRLNRVCGAAAQSFFALTDAEVDRLRELDLDAVEDFARCLTARSHDRLASLFPAASQALGAKELARACDRFLSVHKSAPGERSSELARSFGRFLEDFLRSQPAQPEWLPELVRLELALRLCSLHDGRMPSATAATKLAPPLPESVFRVADGVQLDRYEFDLLPMLDPEPKAAPHDPLRASTCVLIVPQAASRQPRVMRIGAMAMRLLSAFGAGARFEATCASLQGDATSGDARPAMQSAVQQFTRLGALVAVQ